MSLKSTRSLILPLILLTPAALFANTSADAVISYNPGDESAGISAYQNTGAPTLGLPATADGPFEPINNVTPFTPTYDSASLTLVNPGGHLTLHFAQTVSDASGPDIGVFSGVGLIADSASSANNVIASAGPTIFPANINAAIVSVSATANPADFITLNNGNPIALNVPTNAFLNSAVTYDAPDGGFVVAQNGSSLSNPFKPFSSANGLASFSALSYTQILSLLNGSAGGTWLDFSSTGLPAVNYIQFSVPTGANYSLLLDAVTAAPEPTTLTLLALTTPLLLRRRHIKPIIR